MSCRSGAGRPASARSRSRKRAARCGRVEPPEPRTLARLRCGRLIVAVVASRASARPGRRHLRVRPLMGRRSESQPEPPTPESRRSLHPTTPISRPHLTALMCALGVRPRPASSQRAARPGARGSRSARARPGPRHGAVAARRLRAALRLYGCASSIGRPRSSRRLGDVRDLQLQIAWLKGRDAVCCAAAAPAPRQGERALQSALPGMARKDAPCCSMPPASRQVVGP